jgi:hypothetical protein
MLITWSREARIRPQEHCAGPLERHTAIQDACCCARHLSPPIPQRRNVFPCGFMDNPISITALPSLIERSRAGRMGGPARVVTSPQTPFPSPPWMIPLRHGDALWPQRFAGRRGESRHTTRLRTPANWRLTTPSYVLRQRNSCLARVRSGVLLFTLSWSSPASQASGSTVHCVDRRQPPLDQAGCSCCGGRRCRGRTWP